MRPLGLRVLLAGLMMVIACSHQPESQATDSQSPSSRSATEFDGERAFQHVRALVEMGPRPVGSAAHDRARDYIVAELKKYGLTIIKDEFTAQTPLGQRPMVSIIGELKGESDNILILASHYDTKLFTDITFVGANDGGSSTGALLELARVIAARQQKPKHTLWFTFFDGEEAFVNWTQADSKYGSRHLVARLEGERKLEKVKAMILLDMIGDKDLELKRDGYSTPWLVDIIWAAARELGYEKHFSSSETFIDDDHIPFLDKGVPAVDLIDFNYGLFNRYWHTAEDTLDKLSPRSLKIVGDTVLTALPRIEEAVNQKGKS
ncbi:MAG TPA: M28 family peptidase [Blastocatellia bacterium]|nr:M28 family peptidase [Blastocatellia bacterium]